MIGNYWVLPDRNQVGKSLTFKDGDVKELREWMELSKIPKSIIFGIPEELILKDEKIIFAQYARLDNGKNLLCLSMVAGKDCNNRLVTLTNLQIFSNNQYHIPPIIPDNAPNNEMSYFNDFRNISLNNNESIDNMLKAVNEKPFFKTFANEQLKNNQYPYDWTPKKKLKYVMLFSILLIILAVFVMIMMNKT